MNDLINLITAVGFEIPIIAIATVLLTGLIKQPIKRLAGKAKNPTKITRFITLLPVILGFGLTVLSMFIYTGKVGFTNTFFNKWLSSVSLSLAIYAFWEKFVPSEKKILSEAELKANKEAVDKLRSELVDKVNHSEVKVTQNSEQTEVDKNTEHKKIILSNNKNLK